jgi:hypothetical protein
MHDKMDANLGRVLKNWAAQKPLPSGGRDDLLESAASPLYADRSALLTFLHGLFVGQMKSQFYDDGLLAPFAFQRTWSFHIATTFRMVA